MMTTPEKTVDGDMTKNEDRPAPFIYINGYPGVGKLSIARALLLLVRQPAKLVDNHLLIDPVAALFDRSSPDYQPLRQAFRETLLSAIVGSAELRNTTIIFTDSQSSNDAGSAVAREYQDAAKRRGSVFLSFRLECDLEENFLRATSPGRTTGETTKLCDTTIIQHIRETEDIFSFGGEDEDTIDVTSLSKEETAKDISNSIDRMMAIHARRSSRVLNS
jgi:broad-specificity NMP kinase